MRLIFSRKGFDSSSGGCPSPILPGGEIISLPIPDKQSAIRYCDIQWNGTHLGNIVADLTGGRIEPDFRAHLDPDIRHDSVERSAGWRTIFGQCGASQGHLCNCGVGAGDVFLFFGIFRRVIVTSGRFAWDPAARPIHLIWGWMRVGEVLRVSDRSAAPSWAQYHPHSHLCGQPNNTMYLAADSLSLPSTARTRLPGAGIFSRFSDQLQLTDPDAPSHTHWRLPPWMYPKARRPPLTFHADMRRWSRCRGATLLRTVSRGQEFVLDTAHYPEALAWIGHLARGAVDHKREPERYRKHICHTAVAEP